MIEAGVVIGPDGPLYWHLPPGRTGGSIPDSRTLWQVFWEHRKADTLEFAHSHPGSGVPGPSWTDLTTFAAVEAGLGCRLIWWITSSDRVISLVWDGPDRLDYLATQYVDEPDWITQLREYSQKETTK